ncbi:hypothetical protein CANTEDRAFT_113020, partial [Yamadazyma tenuis ATCC 10573]
MSISLWQAAVGLFVSTFASTLLPSLYFHKYSAWMHHHPVNSVLNMVFVDYSYVWFTIMFSGYGIWAYLYQSRYHVFRVFVAYAAYLVSGIVCTVWFFGACLFERVEVAFGGHCDVGGGNSGMSHAACDATDGGVWVGGFDTSGHYFVLLSLSLLSVDQLVCLRLVGNQRSDRYQERSDEYQGRNDNGNVSGTVDVGLAPSPESVLVSSQLLRALILTVSLCLFGLWYLEFCITSLFFHTPTERLTGLLLGLTIPMLVHYKLAPTQRVSS